MARHALLSVLLLLALTLEVSGQSIDVSLAVVQVVNAKERRITIKKAVHRMVPEVRDVAVINNGQQETREVTTYVTVVEEMQHSFAIGKDDVAVHTGDGKLLEGEAAWKRLEPGLVVVIGGKEMLGPRYARVFRPETILLVIGSRKAAPGGQ